EESFPGHLMDGVELEDDRWRLHMIDRVRDEVPNSDLPNGFHELEAVWERAKKDANEACSDGCCKSITISIRCLDNDVSRIFSKERMGRGDPDCSSSLTIECR